MKRSPIPVAALVAAAVLSAAPAHASEGQGFAEIRASAMPGVTGRSWQLVERVRPTFETELSDRFKLVAVVEAGLAEGRNVSEELERTFKDAGLAPLLDAVGCQWPRPTNSLFRIDRADDYLDVDRLYLDYYGEKLDVRVGRQALHWGSAQFFNPTDPFPEVLLAEPWRPRRGVNAARAHLALSGISDATAVLAIDDALRTPRAAARVRLNVAKIDAALIGTWRGGSDALVGVDLRGTFGVGWWLEAAVLPRNGTVHEEIAAGIDYSFPVLERLVVSAQYYRNGAGATDPDRYARLAGITGASAGGPTCPAGSPFGAAQPDPFAPFVLARDYLLVAASAQVLPELSINLPLLQNLNDGTAVVIPTVNYAATDWLELALSAQLPVAVWGEGGEFRPRPQDLRIERDLGPPVGVVRADFSGLVPDATVTLWTRASF